MVLTVMEKRAHCVLRVALNMNNTALVQRAGDGYTGLAVRIAEHIGAVMGAPLIYVEHPNAQSVLEAQSGGWDIAFLAIDPSRTDRIAFSDPYHSVEATFLVREALAHRSCAEILQGDHMIMSAKGAAYQARLTALRLRGPLFVAASPDEARQRFLSGEGDALAGIRETLDSVLAPGVRVLPDNFAQIDQAVAVPLAASSQIALINRTLRKLL